ncbi:APH(6) family putative aminoglycoside O-phosphotransferase [Paracoccus sp. 11-3]|uniref:APH(6) family putative aminoglycoside O-phosphotransferase n=2 Tax=Paracoccus amoyensis TaxID=2760093 RepID=A0A926JCU3_9RHOB|nr:aminoglycoside phosphotransferase family protein [Paracoccus amoyensis]MBC9246143.1 APH(6) family putative aminoglycoside O-phosphotransferase [Paracoccus amoyensis]
MFHAHLLRWNLTPDGDPIATHAANLLPVLSDGRPAMLKIAHEEEERQGGALLAWWDGQGAARVYARDADALLMERALDGRNLADMARNGQDDEASRILCATADQLHRPRNKPAPDLTPLTVWFRELQPAAERYGGILVRSHQVARELLADQHQITPLHGDLHHDNVLDFGARGWLAIDPKHIIGERTFDFANIFTNPDLSDPSRPVATLPGVFAHRLSVVSDAARLQPERLLRWILAWTGLSAAWYLGDDDPDAAIDLHIAELAAVELDR